MYNALTLHRTHTIAQLTHTFLLQMFIPGYSSATCAFAELRYYEHYFKEPWWYPRFSGDHRGGRLDINPMSQSVPWRNRQCNKYTHFMCQARGASNISVQAHIETARLLSCKQNLDLHQFVRSRTHLAKSLSLTMQKQQLSSSWPIFCCCLHWLWVFYGKLKLDLCDSLVTLFQRGITIDLILKADL